MVPYSNLSRDSRIAEYERGVDYIKVRYHDSDVIYVFDYAKPGVKHVEMMKRLAIYGQGLGTYIDEKLRGEHSRIE